MISVCVCLGRKTRTQIEEEEILKIKKWVKLLRQKLPFFSQISSRFFLLSLHSKLDHHGRHSAKVAAALCCQLTPWMPKKVVIGH